MIDQRHLNLLVNDYLDGGNTSIGAGNIPE